MEKLKLTNNNGTWELTGSLDDKQRFVSVQDVNKKCLGKLLIKPTDDGYTIKILSNVGIFVAKVEKLTTPIAMRKMLKEENPIYKLINKKKNESN